MKKLTNLGFISKRKVAVEIAKLHDELENRANSTDNAEWRKQYWYAQSALTCLCRALNIKPMYLSENAGGVKTEGNNHD